MKVKVLVPLFSWIEPENLEAIFIGRVWLEDAEFTLFHVVEAPMVTALDSLSREISEASSWLNKIKSWLKVRGFDVKVKVVSARNAGEAIASEANENHDLILIIRFKRRFSMHRTTAKVLSHSRKPILIVPLEKSEP